MMMMMVMRVLMVMMGRDEGGVEGSGREVAVR